MPRWAPRVQLAEMALLLLLACSLGLAPTVGDGEQVVTLDPSDVLDFGRVAAGGRTRAETLTLTNDGTTTFDVESAEIDSAAAGVFSFGSDLPLPVALAPAQEFPVVVRFGAFDDIPYDGTVTLTLDDGSVHSVSLRGEGCPDANGDNTCDR